MAKKKAAKKSKSQAKPKKSAKPARKVRKMKPIKRSKPAARMPEVVTPPVVDVTPQVQQQVVEVKPEPMQSQPQMSTLSPMEAQEKHEELTQALTAPPKRGFWARLFGKK